MTVQRQFRRAALASPMIDIIGRLDARAFAPVNLTPKTNTAGDRGIREQT